MRFIGKSGKVYNCVATTRPEMTDRGRYRDRSWRKEKRTINDKEVDFWYEATWGYYYYFELNCVWYKSPIFNDRSNYRIKNGKAMEAIDDFNIYTKDFLKNKK